MPSLNTKWDLIRRLRGRRVLDVGGVGYDGEPEHAHGRTRARCTEREQLFREAWAGAERTTLDCHPSADIKMDLNALPLPRLDGRWDVVTLFDVLEHVRYPALVLEWAPADEVWITLPGGNLLCHLTEERLHRLDPTFRHLYGWTLHTGSLFVEACGWRIVERGYAWDWQSWRGRLFSALVASRFPRHFGGVYIVARRAA